MAGTPPTVPHQPGNAFFPAMVAFSSERRMDALRATDLLVRLLDLSPYARSEAHRLPTALDQLHCFQFERSSAGFLLVGSHLALLCSSRLFHLCLLHQIRARSTPR